MVRCPVCFYPKVADCYECDHCKESPAYKVYSVARYDGSLSYSVLDSFKFHGHRQMAKVVAMYLGHALDVLDESKSALLVPIPCSGARLRRFGWDQMVEVCKALDRPYLQLIENADADGMQQKRMNREQRISSSSSRFRIKGNIDQGLTERRIIVLDDIITTMSTMQSAIEVLTSNGFKDVCGASWLCEL